MKEEQYNLILRKISKSYPEFKIKYGENNKENDRLIYQKDNKKAIIGLDNNIEKISFGIIHNNNLNQLESKYHYDLEGIFDNVKELINLISYQ